MGSSGARLHPREATNLDTSGRVRGPGRYLVLYARLLGPLLAGYLLFDRAFAYVHLPGTPVFVGEMVLAIGVVGAVSATGYLRVPVREEPILALLGAFVAWGLLRALPGLRTYGMDAIRDSALWYYCLFAFLTVAALARWPQLLDHLIDQLRRFTPWLLVWLPAAVVLTPLAPSGLYVPFSTTSVLSHKPGNAAVAALLVLGLMWLFPETRSPRSRALWSVFALLVVALVATQNRGGLVGVTAGGLVGLAFVRNRVGLVARAIGVMTVGLAVALLLPVSIGTGIQGRSFSATQLVDNVVSLGGAQEPGNLGGTVQGRQQLWTRILHKQENDHLVLEGSGFGPNLAAQVGVFDAGTENLRSPHNSHLDVLARMGVVGFSMWIALWIAWYYRLANGCRRLERHGLRKRRQVAVLCMSVTTAILVSSFFDPQLEGPQVAALLWTLFGIGVAATSVKKWFADVPAGTTSGADPPSRPRTES